MENFCDLKKIGKERWHLYAPLLLLLMFLSIIFTQRASIFSPADRPEVSSTSNSSISPSNQTDPIEENHICTGRYIYVHDLPPKFNEAILEDCMNLVRYTNMCIYFENGGFGPKLNNSQGIFSDNGWFHTHQFSLELIFNRRIKQYDCLTRNSSLANAVYVPFYGGFDESRHQSNYSIQVRDELSYELVDWLKNTTEWKTMGGKDHFIVLGRITWEFRRNSKIESDFGNNLLLLPEIKNMTTMNLESSPWDPNNFAIPYPTYFHPSMDVELFIWQDRIRKSKREWLFSFAGAPLPWQPKSIRNNVFDQCKKSNYCKVFQCAHEGNICTPDGLIQLFQNSIFCLQPPGDSPTRRSTFDSILAGCIPVFFQPDAAYVQYVWYLPRNYTKYSVFIWEDDIRKKNVSIEDTLRRISPRRIEEMRAEVINLIPKIIYADSRSKSRTFKDAFDVALDDVIQRVMRFKGLNTSHEEVKLHGWETFF